MNMQRAPVATTKSTRLSDAVDTGLHGRWLFLARMLWLAVFVLTLVVFCANLLAGNYGLITTISLVANTSIWFAVALVLFWRKSSDRAILLLSFALVLTPGYFIPRYPGVLVNDGFWWVPVDVLAFLTGIALNFWYTFPDGRFVPGFARWLALGCIAVSFLPIPIFGVVHFGNYWLSPLFPLVGASYPWNWWLTRLFALVRIAFYGSVALALLYRYRHRATPVQRQQIKWVVFALAIFVGEVMVAELAVFVIPSSFPVLGLLTQLYQHIRLITPLVYSFIPLSIGIALLRYRLWDIDIIINRTLVYGVLTLSTVALYVLVVVGLGTLLQAQGNLGLALLATGLVAVLFQPLRTRLQRAVNHLMYGERDDPYRVISRLGQRLEATLAPEAVLPTIVETVAQALKLPYAAISLQQGEEFVTAASYGSARGGELVRLPLVYQSEQVGELVLAPRAPGERFSHADRSLLEDVARQAGIAAHAVRLTADLKRLTVDLQRERERLVTTREEERRRLRRDLHDGLGPQLAGLTLKLETARNRLAHVPLAETLLSDLAGRTQATVAEIRRMVYALRPPALDELGLLSALRELTLHYSDQVSMHLDAPECLPELPAAVEVAVYRIAQEALTNVVRHAAAQRCAIHLALDEPTGWLSLSIQDDGCGLPPARRLGVGLVSMRERAEELGGICNIEPVESGGTRVLARLPYARSESADGAFNMVPQKEE